MPRGVPKNAPGQGRPTLKTDGVVEVLLQNRRLGLSPKTCCDIAKVDVTTVYKWIKDDPDFSAKWGSAGSEMIRRLHVEVAKKEPWKILKNLEPSYYRDRIENEISGPGGGPIKLIVEDLRVGVTNAKKEDQT